MSDAPGKLGSLLARLNEEGHSMEDHPASERLSAFEANELPLAEQAAVQQHLASCSFCTERLEDLRRFLAPMPEDRAAEGIVDLEAAADWRKLRREMHVSPARWRRAFTSAGAVVAAMLAVGLAWASYRIVSLEADLAKPITDLQTTTLRATGSRRAESGAPGPQSFKLGHVAAFETLSDHPYGRYRLIFRDEKGHIKNSVEDTEEDGMITLFLPRSFLPPGLYRIQVVGLDGAAVHPVRDFEVRILR